MWKVRTSALHKVYKVAKKFTLDFVQFRLPLARSHVIRPDEAVYLKMWIYLHFSFRLFMTDDVLYIDWTPHSFISPQTWLLFTKQLTRCALYAQLNKDPPVPTSNVEKQNFLTVKIEMLLNYTPHLQYAEPTSRLGWILFKNLKNIIIWRRPLLAVSNIWCQLSALLSRLTCQKQINQKGEIGWLWNRFDISNK